MKKYLCTLLLLSLVACGFEPATPEDIAEAPVEVAVSTEAITTANLLKARQLAYDSYTASTNVIPSTECKSFVQHLTCTYLPQQQLRAACGTTLNIGGCSFYSSQQVFIEDVLISSTKTHAHEFLHMLLGCQTGSTDHDHTTSAWAFLAVLTFGL